LRAYVFPCLTIKNFLSYKYKEKNDKVSKILEKIKRQNDSFLIDKKVVVLNSFTANYFFDDLLTEDTYDLTELPYRVPRNNINLPPLQGY